MRYTTSSPSVNKMRLRSSATAKRCLTLSTAIGRLQSRGPLAPLLAASRWGAPSPPRRPRLYFQFLRGPAGRRNLLSRLAAELVRLHRQPLANLAARQHLHALRGVRHESLFAEQVQRDDRALVEALAERVQVHHRVLDAERFVEPALRTRRCSGIWPP